MGRSPSTDPPICRACPRCGSEEYAKFRPKRMMYYAQDRRCSRCGRLYTPPTPSWAAILFLVLGGLLGLFGVAAVAVELWLDTARGEDPNPCGLFCPVLCAAIGGISFVYGVKALNERPVEPPDETTNPTPTPPPPPPPPRDDRR